MGVTVVSRALLGGELAGFAPCLLSVSEERRNLGQTNDIYLRTVRLAWATARKSSSHNQVFPSAMIWRFARCLTNAR